MTALRRAGVLTLALALPAASLAVTDEELQNLDTTSAGPDPAPQLATGNAAGSGLRVLLGLLAVVGAAAMWAGGSVASQRMKLPRDPFVSGAWQMLLGGGVCALTGALVGELGDLHPAEFSLKSVAGLAYLVVFGSWLAFTAYAWLLQNAPVSRVATYAYVNPVVAIALGWAILDEAVTTLTFAGAAIIVASVAAVVRTESRRSNPR